MDRVAEALVLSLAGSGVGLLIARWSAPLVARFMLKGWRQDSSGTTALQLAPDAHTFGLVGPIVVAVCVLFATMPTWHIDRGSVAQAFQGGSRVSARIGRLAPILVAAQVVLALVASLDAGG